MRIETKCVQAGYEPGNGQARVLPIYQSTTFKYESSDTMGDLFDLKVGGHFYTRLSNPTLAAVEEKIAALEGGVGALLTASGQSANMLALLNLCGAGDHVVCASMIYGGTYNLFNVTLRKLGIEFTFVSPDASDEEIQSAFRPQTKAYFGETLANPAVSVMDIGRHAAIAHRNSVPLIIDNTFPTPILCRPIEHGADIVTHSTTKYMNGHATTIGGAIVDSGNFDWANGRFPEFTVPDDSYHGLIYTQAFGNQAYIVKARVQLMRDMGVTCSPNDAFLLNIGLESLHLRMERHCENALRVAQFLQGHPAVAWIHYPGLPDDQYYHIAQKMLPLGASGVISFGVKGGRDAAKKLMDSLKLIALVVHVADARTCALHPASTTHRQLTEEQLAHAGVGPDLVRLSVGIENVEDIIEDLAQALG